LPLFISTAGIVESSVGILHRVDVFVCDWCRWICRVLHALPTPVCRERDYDSRWSRHDWFVWS